MSRHRNIRNRTFSEDLDDFDQCEKSFEEDISVSPATANLYLYDHQMITNQTETISLKNQSFDNDNAERLLSCIQYFKDMNINNSPEEITNILKKCNYNIESTLDVLLNEPKKAEENVPENSTVSKLYKAITTKSDLNSMDFNCHNFRKFIKDTLITSIQQYRISELRGIDIDAENSKLPSPDVSNNLIKKAKNKKAKIKTEPKINIDVPCKSNPQSIKITKTIKHKSVDEIQRLYEKRLNEKLQLNLVIVGHVDAGKSTIMGHLLSLMGNISKKNMHKFETESKKVGKASFMFAWVLDETEEERNRGITIDIGQYRFETNKYIVNILDAPGHRDFIPNMITGATKADVAILVIDASNGEFESGFEAGGQTQEHILILRSFGITQIAIAINKMDNINFNRQRYEEICEKIGKFLKQVGFKENSIEYIPCSGMNGDNLVKLSSNEKFNWYNGQTLIEIIDKFSANSRPIDKPFKMSISDIFKGQTSGIYLYGKIDYGFVEANQKLLILPNNEFCTIKNIIINDSNSTEAFAGDVVSLNIPEIDGLELSIGNVLCDNLMPCTIATRFEARIVTFGTQETPIINGCFVIIYSVCLNDMACITKLCSLLDKNRNKIIRKNPRLIGKNQAAIVEFTTMKPVCIETFDQYKEYGRFVFRSEHVTLGTGIVTKIINQ